MINTPTASQVTRQVHPGSLPYGVGFPFAPRSLGSKGKAMPSDSHSRLQADSIAECPKGHDAMLPRLAAPTHRVQPPPPSCGALDQPRNASLPAKRDSEPGVAPSPTLPRIPGTYCVRRYGFPVRYHDTGRGLNGMGGKQGNPVGSNAITGQQCPVVSSWIATPANQRGASVKAASSH